MSGLRLAEGPGSQLNLRKAPYPACDVKRLLNCGNWTRLSAALTAHPAARRETHTFPGPSRRRVMSALAKALFVASESR